MKKPKRVLFEVVPSRSGWWRTTRNGIKHRLDRWKVDAVRHAAAAARADQPSELVIKCRSGRIGKGSSGRRTYGADPERTRG